VFVETLPVPVMVVLPVDNNPVIVVLPVASVLEIITAPFTVRGNGILTPEEFAIKLFDDVLALIETSVVELTTIAGPEVLPVVTVKLVEPSLVFIDVVVKLDIKLLLLYHLHRLLN
jgi:hypothetical protein